MLAPYNDVKRDILKIAGQGSVLSTSVIEKGCLDVNLCDVVVLCPDVAMTG